MSTGGVTPPPVQLVIALELGDERAARVRSGPTALAACSKARPADQARMAKMSWCVAGPATRFSQLSMSCMPGLPLASS